jgi:hypothetical protein
MLTFTFIEIFSRISIVMYRWYCKHGWTSFKHCWKIEKCRLPNILSTYCILRPEQLSSIKISLELYEILSDVIKIVNIFHKAINSRLFKSLCGEMDSQYIHILLHAEVRWFSRSKVLTRQFVLYEEVKLFFQQ